VDAPANDGMPPSRRLDVRVGEGSQSFFASTSRLSSSVRSTAPSALSSTSPPSVDGVVASSRLCGTGAPGAGPTRGAGGTHEALGALALAPRADTGGARAAPSIAMPMGIAGGIIDGSAAAGASARAASAARTVAVCRRMSPLSPAPSPRPAG
jgi:hypothetical protein